MPSFRNFIGYDPIIGKPTIIPSKAGLIIIDMINEFCKPGGWADVNGFEIDYYKKCIEPLKLLIAHTRSVKIPVIWLNWGIKDINKLPNNQFFLWKKTKEDIGLEKGHFAFGSWGVQIIEELQSLVAPTDLIVSKERISGFYEGSQLSSVLNRNQITDLMVTGINTDQCVLHTISDANFLGFNCTLIQDCCATSSPDFCEHAALYNVKECFGAVSNVSTIIGHLK
jgi:nicotinamidase-related amidase